MYKKILFITLALVIIFAGISGILGYLWQNENRITDNETFKLPPRPDYLNQKGENELKVPALPPVPEQQIINNYSGQIIEIAANKLILSTNYGNKTVNFDGQTIFEKLFAPRVPQLPPLPGQTIVEENSIPNPEKITLNDLQSGQKIEVYSEENLKNKEEFVADKISLVIKLNN
ncbi:hypothetical protein H6761_02525 [Candidatus Nomurabacteria bacterium]|nr:hypothetical protein [Candidatus Nomurabacteria bacterium]